MSRANERQQLKFATQTVSFGIEDMLKHNRSHFFYSNIVHGDLLMGPGVLAKHVLAVVILLQDAYRGRAVISRTPGGLVAHPILGPRYVSQSGGAGAEQSRPTQ